MGWVTMTMMMTSRYSTDLGQRLLPNLPKLCQLSGWPSMSIIDALTSVRRKDGCKRIVYLIDTSLHCTLLGTAMPDYSLNMRQESIDYVLLTGACQQAQGSRWPKGGCVR